MKGGGAAAADDEEAMRKYYTLSIDPMGITDEKELFDKSRLTEGRQTNETYTE